MMKPIAREVQRAIVASDSNATLLSADQYRALRTELEARYTAGQSRWPLWENFKFPAAVHLEDGWQRIADFVGEKPCCLIFNPHDAENAFAFDSGDDLVRTLGEAFGFEFYVVDDPLSFCLCFNHHDMLLGAGAAKTWVASLQST